MVNFNKIFVRLKSEILPMKNNEHPFLKTLSQLRKYLQIFVKLTFTYEYAQV